MRATTTRLTAALAAFTALALLAGACSTSREITRPEPEPVTTEALVDALITEDDLTDGAQVGEDEIVDEDSEADARAFELPGDNPLEDLECLQTFEEESNAVGTSTQLLEASRQFQVGEMVVTNSVTFLPSAGGAGEQVFHDLADNCEAAVTEGFTVRTGPLDFGVLSDNALSLKLEIEPPGSAPIAEVDIVLMRQGDLIDLVVAAGPRPSNKKVLDEAVRAAIGNVVGLHNRVT